MLNSSYRKSTQWNTYWTKRRLMTILHMSQTLFIVWIHGNCIRERMSSNRQWHHSPFRLQHIGIQKMTTTLGSQYQTNFAIICEFRLYVRGATILATERTMSFLCLIGSFPMHTEHRGHTQGHGRSLHTPYFLLSFFLCHPIPTTILYPILPLPNLTFQKWGRDKEKSSWATCKDGWVCLCWETETLSTLSTGDI